MRKEAGTPKREEIIERARTIRDEIADIFACADRKHWMPWAVGLALKNEHPEIRLRKSVTGRGWVFSPQEVQVTL